MLNIVSCVSDDPDPALDYDYSNVLPNQMEKAKILFETVGEVIGRSTRTTISLQSSFYELGGNSLNSIYTVAKLRDRGYAIEITNFIMAKSLKETMDYMTENELHNRETANDDNYTAYPLADQYKSETIQ